MATGKSRNIKDSLVEDLNRKDGLSIFRKTNYLFGDLLFKKSDGKVLQVLNYGECYEDKVISRWLDNNYKLKVNGELNFEWCKGFSQNVDKLISISSLSRPTEKERLLFFQSFGTWLRDNCSAGATHQDLLVVVHYYFCNLSDELKDLFLSLPTEIRLRNLLVSSHAVVLLILNRYSHLDYLKDFYSICLLLDFKLSYEMWDESEKKKVLSFYQSKQEIRSYHEVSFKQYLNKINSEYEKQLSFEGVKLLYKVNFEKLDGSGYFNQKMDDFLDEESILVTLLSIFSDFNKEVLLEKMATPYRNINNFPVRLRRFIRESLGEMDDDYLKVEGL